LLLLASGISVKLFNIRERLECEKQPGHMQIDESKAVYDMPIPFVTLRMAYFLADKLVGLLW
jgi:hypothetical protein